MQKILIWGSGIYYEQFATLIKYYESQKQFKVIGITSDDEHLNSLDGWSFIKKDEICDVKYDWILVCVQNFRKILQAVRQMEIPEKILLSPRILHLPNFDFEKYIRLSSLRTSIFSNNCWAGIMYNRLGLKVLSPFHNMFEKDTEYVDFLKNAREIISENRLVFEKTSFDQVTQLNYPIFRLGSLHLNMNHYLDKKKAEKKWYERADRINWDNLFIMMWSENPSCIEKFAALGYEKKICFTSLKTDIPHTFRVPMYREKKPWEIVNGSAMGTYKLYDPIELLLTGKAVNNRST